MMQKHLVVLLLFIIIAVYSSPSISTNTDPIPDYFYNVYNKLYKLRMSGVDVDSIIKELNDVLVKWQIGKITDSEFMRKLEEIDHKASILEEKTGEAKMIIGLLTVLSISFLIIMPALFYWLFPMFYLYIWFRVRCRWVIEE